MALSTHPGGSADKAGFFHESLWGIRCMVDVLNGEAASISIETPGDDGAEFSLQRGTIREHWQAKRQVTGQGTWSLEKLKKVLEFFLLKFRAGEQCVFASVSDAPELRMLIENAQAAKKAGGGLEYFKQQFQDKKRAAQFTELRGLVEAVSEDETFSFLCTLTLHGGREITLEPEFGFRLGVMYQGPWQTTMASLRELFLRSTHETLTATDIERHLQAYGIMKRRSGMPGARDRILAVTSSYIAGQHSKFIRRTAIKRAVAATIVTNIQSSAGSLDILITSPAGGGKSACICQIVEGLQSVGIPVLAFRLDRVEPVPTAIQLGEKLGLGESPAYVLAESFPKQPVVLVVDQLDCVSTASGRHSDFFDTIAALRDEVLGLRVQQIVHLIFACRKFDFEHDHRLKQLAAKEQPLIELAEFTPEEVKSVLQQEGGDISNLTSRQQAMLCLPQNLSLFIEARLAKTENRFSTPKDLCDAYWAEKRRSISAKNPEFDRHWQPVIQQLASTMSSQQELSVLAKTLDEFPQEFLERMASEGVLTWDGKRYGFGHETFFDYCFARTQPKGGRDFVRFLERDSQHLFRRAQLRQVLAFLRDEDFQAYTSSVANLICSEKIRAHLKLLTVELLAAHPQVRIEELGVLMPWIESGLTRRSKGTKKVSHPVLGFLEGLLAKMGLWRSWQNRKQQSEKLASRICDRFLSSGTLFTVADQQGYISKWLYSDESGLQDTITLYLRWQTGLHAERIADLLEPLARKPEWSTRLRYMMEGQNLDQSRRFFDLFLLLLANGTLDDARDRFASNGTFWSMLYGLAEKRPEWCAELAARWLDRQVALSKADGDSQGKARPQLNDGFGTSELLTSARGNPKAFLEHVLPSVLKAAEAFIDSENEAEFPRDAIWPIRMRSEHIGLPEAYLQACETALELLGKDSPEMLHPFAQMLRAPKLYTANHLLMSVYLSSPATFADEAIRILGDEPNRLFCGYTDSAYWHSRMVIEKCSILCGKDFFLKLETVLLTYVSPYERTKEGMRLRGHAAYTLSSALAQPRLGIRTKAKIAEWKDKFPAPDRAPVGIRSYTVGSPIEQDAANHMTDEQWLGAIAKYKTEDRAYDFNHPEKGGALELARMLQKFTQEQPARFAQLTLNFPENTHPYYFSHVLSGLNGAAIPAEQKLAVARRVFGLNHQDCFRASLSLLARLPDLARSPDVSQFIKSAAGNPNPESEQWDNDKESTGGNILNHGINTVRGYAAEAIRDLIIADKEYLGIFRATIEKLLTDPSLGVRSCVASTLIAVARHDTALSLQWSTKLFDADDRLLATPYAQDLIHKGLPEHLQHFTPLIQRMLVSTKNEVREAGGTLACLARLYHVEAEALSANALRGDLHCRLGACEVAKSNLLHVDCRKWCESALEQLFSDESKEVRRKAASCFWHLWKAPDTPLTDFDALIRSFLSSKAFMDEPTYLLHAIEENRHRVPEAVLEVCDAFISRCAEAARDISTSIAGDEMTVGKLVFTAYAQLQSQALQQRALDAIDRMSIEGLNSANKHLSEFER